MTQMQSFVLVIVLLFTCGTCRKHKLKIENDVRNKIDLTTFGFLPWGELLVNVTDFMFENENGKGDPIFDENSFGFTLDKTSNSGISPDLENNKQECIFKDQKIYEDKSVSIVFFRMDMRNASNPRLLIDRKGEDLKKLLIYVPSEDGFRSEAAIRRRRRRGIQYLSDSYLFHRYKRQVTPTREDLNDANEDNFSGDTTLITQKILQPTLTANAIEAGTAYPDDIDTTSSPDKNKDDGKKDFNDDSEVDNFAIDSIPMKVKKINGRNAFSAHFIIWIKTTSEQGLYNLFFHNCDNYNTVKEADHKVVNFTVHLTESNLNGTNFLSAGEIPLPNIYGTLSGVYLGLGCFWFYIIKRATEGVFKTHYLMVLFLFVKSLSLLFHSLNYVFIRKLGHHAEAFAILYYITYLMKGTLLFVTIVLVGAGWTFVKHILSDRDKKIFIIVIPVQVLANVARIIIEETEEGQSQYLLWKQLFIMLDLLCCGAILFPVVWSIRHLQDASQTDGKAAINLVKLKIFRHFYILIVCYIYLTRIMVYLLAMTVPFQYDWVCEVFREGSALIFFVVTGYYFRPASDNPYLQIPQSDDEEEMEEVLTETGFTENITRVNIRDPNNDSTSSTTFTTVKQRESSHEYD